MLDRIDKEIGFLTRALQLRAHRQQVIASNIANADTPNYQARDVDFAEALRGTGGRGALALVTTSPRHMHGSGAAGGAAQDFVKYRTVIQPSIDNNTVDMNVERAAFADNALHYQMITDRIVAKSREIIDVLKAAP
jgi:flagellar basal-body rod protein FlgB